MRTLLKLKVATSILILILAFACFTAGFAQAPLQPPYADRLRSFLKNQMETYKIPGMAVVVVRDGAVEYLEGLGIANPAGDAVTPDTPFLLASVSKSITAVAVMQMEEAGKLSLADPVKKYLPWFDVAGGAGGEITIAHLLYHTSGFSEQAGLEANLAPDAPDALEAGVRKLADERLEFNPGESFEYSNLNYNVLAMVVQEVSGQPYAEYIQEHIFDPLGMRSSYTGLAAARAAGAASGYYPFFGFPLVTDRVMPYSRGALAAAGFWSTASDMGRYLLAHLNEGQYEGNALYSAETAARLYQPGYMFDAVQGYAMGWTNNQGFMGREVLEPLGQDMLEYENLTVLFHEGDWLGFKSMAFMLPEIEYGMLMLMNTNNPTITSAFRYFAWDVALVALGGEAQYFPPGEDFLMRHSRWIFGGVALLLAAGLVYSYGAIKRVSRVDGPSPSRMRKALVQVGIPLVAGLALAGYIFLGLMPERNVSLRTLLGFAPDLGLLGALILALAAAWVMVGAVWLIKILKRQKNAP